MAAPGRQGSQVISTSENPQARSPDALFFLKQVGDLFSRRPQNTEPQAVKNAADCFTVKIKQIKQSNMQGETRVMDLPARSFDLARPGVAPPLLERWNCCWLLNMKTYRAVIVVFPSRCHAKSSYVTRQIIERVSITVDTYPIIRSSAASLGGGEWGADRPGWHHPGGNTLRKV